MSTMYRTVYSKMAEKYNRAVTEAEVKRVKKIIKSCIESQKDQGMSSAELMEEYEKATGEQIPFHKLGYNSLFNLIRDIPEIISGSNMRKGHVLLLKTNNNPKYNMKTRVHEEKTHRSKQLNRLSKWTQSRSNKRSQLFNSYRNFNDSSGSLNRRLSFSDSGSDQELSADENPNTPVIVEKTPEKGNHWCHSPVVGDSQLIGDDFFLQLSIKYLNDPLERESRTSPITCGTVQSGLTIKKATKRLENITAMADNLTINVGAVDIYDRQTLGEMISDYTELLDELANKYMYSAQHITLCTIPPLANVGMFCDQDKFRTHARFNVWLRNFAKQNGYKLLDLHHEFSTSSYYIDYSLFQESARNVSGTKHAHVLWNFSGRQKAMRLLLKL